MSPTCLGIPMQEYSLNQRLMTQDSIEESAASLFQEDSVRISRLVRELNSLDADISYQNSYRHQFQFLEKQSSLCVILNVKAEIIYLNSFGCELLGVNNQDYYGQCWLTNYLLPEQRTEITIVFEQMMKGFGDPFSRYCNEIHSNHQSNITLEWQNHIWRNHNKTVLGCFSVGTQLGISYS